MNVKKAAAQAARRLNRKLEKRMKELWEDGYFRLLLDGETADINKKNFRAYVRKAIKKSEEECR